MRLTSWAPVHLWFLRSWLAAALLAYAALAPAAAADPEPAPGTTRTEIFTLAKLGVYGPAALRGASPTAYMSVAVRADEVVAKAQFKLVYTYSPSLIFPLSHLKIYLNDEVVATLPLEKEGAGQPVTRLIDLDPRLFTDYNQIRVQMIAHYTVEDCEDAYHSSLWTDISAASALTLATERLVLPDDLALLPSPFFDPRDARRVVVPFVLPANADTPTLRAAGTVSSWLGALAAYRGTRFPTPQAPPADASAIAFVLAGAVPAWLGTPDKPWPAITGPSLTLIANPASLPQSGRKLLVLAGRTPQDLQQAAYALVQGQPGMAGSRVAVQSVDLGPRRRPYDAPNWAPTDRPIAFKELVSDPMRLQVVGFDPPAIRLDFRLPPDLYAWARRNAPMEVKYRYTAPPSYNDSVLNISVNERLVRSRRLKPLDSTDDDTRLTVPLLWGAEVTTVSDAPVPAFNVGSNNQIQLQFHHDPQKTGLCKSTAADATRSAVDPDSTIDFSRFAHFAAMPDLGYFANSGFPYTRMADLSDTAVIMPDAPNAQDQQALLELLGLMGRDSGLAALRVTLLPAKEIDSARGHDLLVIGTGSAGDLLAKWGHSLPMLIERGKTEIALRDQRSSGWRNWLLFNRRDPPTPLGRAILAEGGPMAALVGFRSPYGDDKSVVALTATGSDQLASVTDLLNDNSRLNLVHGDLAVVRGKQAASLRLGDLYYVGDLPWYARVWVWLSNYPVLMAIAGILAGLIAALSIFWALGRLAARRAEDSEP